MEAAFAVGATIAAFFILGVYIIGSIIDWFNKNRKG